MWVASAESLDLLGLVDWNCDLPIQAGPESSYDGSRSGKLSLDLQEVRAGNLMVGGAARVALRLPYEVREDLTCFPFQVIFSTL
jgi:hypothetical protein